MEDVGVLCAEAGKLQPNLGYCEYQPWGDTDCSHTEDVGVLCSEAGKCLFKNYQIENGFFPWNNNVLCPIAPLIHSRLSAMVGRSGW